VLRSSPYRDKKVVRCLCAFSCTLQWGIWRTSLGAQRKERVRWGFHSSCVPLLCMDARWMGASTILRSWIIVRSRLIGNSSGSFTNHAVQLKRGARVTMAWKRHTEVLWGQICSMNRLAGVIYLKHASSIFFSELIAFWRSWMACFQSFACSWFTIDW
jgi:hypothetical protein